MRYPLIVFDFDGTLADSWASGMEIFHRIGPGLGLKPIADLEAARSLPTRELLKEIGVSFWKLPKVVRAYQAAAAEHADQLKLFPAWPGVLARLAANGHRLGILSSNREDSIRACLHANGVEDYFAFVIGFPKLFGKAKALRRILKQERIDRSQVLYVGDEMRDVEAAKKAKVAMAAVSWGFHTEALLRTIKPDAVLVEPGELIALGGSHHDVKM
jgi:phosphoglycolate phosphatase